MMSGIFEKFTDTVERSPDLPALRMKGEEGVESFALRKIYDRAVFIGKHLSSLGIKKGDRAALFSENRPEWGIAYLGIVSIGAVAVPLDAQYTMKEVRNLLRDSESRAIFTSGALLPLVEEASQGLDINILRLEEPLPEPLPAPSLAKEGLGKVLADDPASLLYTSGTTGIPKGVELTHGNLLANADSIIKSGIIQRGDHILDILPLHHSYPFMVCFLVPILFGGRTTYLNSLKGPDIVRTVREEGITIVVGVPQLFTLMRKSILGKINALPGLMGGVVRALFAVSRELRKRTGINIGKAVFRKVHKEFGDSLRFFASGGARLEPAVARDMEGLGFTLIEGYGLSETSPVVTFNLPGKKKIGSVGRALDRVEVRIDNPDAAGVGEILIKGPSVMQGYYRNREATDEVIKDGWFHSGDLGRLDEEGFLFITGRSKEVIVLGSGKNIYPEEVENHYMQNPYIKEICVVGIPDRDQPESIGGIKALVLPDYEKLAADGVVNVVSQIRWQIEDLSAALPSYKRVLGVGILKEPLPRTHIGKIKRFMVKDDDREPPPSPSPPLTEEDRILMESDAGRAVLHTLSSITDKEVFLHSNLEMDLGIDSLGRVELIVALERALGVSVPPSFSAKVATVREVITEAAGLKGGASGLSAPRGPVSWNEILRVPPSEATGIRKETGQRTVGDAVLRFSLWLLYLLFRAFFRLEVRGAENIPAEGPCIIAPNHVSILDGFLVGSAIRRRLPKLYVMGFKGYFQGVVASRLGRWSHVIIIDADSGLSESLQASAHVLRQGVALIVFPEGGRSVQGRVLPFMKGIGILTKETSVPVVPALIKGAYEVLPRGASLPKLGKITVTFGKPVTSTDIEGLGYQEIADRLRERVVGLDL